jgi:hypothetical protein
MNGKMSEAFLSVEHGRRKPRRHILQKMGMGGFDLNDCARHSIWWL